jgi:MFS transporter, DHA1 family, staphyloferrin B biosynthesis exporter
MSADPCATALVGEAPACWRRNLQLLWSGQFFVTAGLTVIVPLLPFYLEDLGATDAAANRFWTGMSLAAPALPLMFAAPLWGRLGDRHGRKPMVVRALFGIAASVVLMGLARTPWQFFLCRLAQGAFGGVDDSAAAFVSTQVPAAERGKALGVLQSATAAGALSGPLIGGFLSSTFGFGPIIVTVGLLVGASGLLAATLLDERRTAELRRGKAPMGRVVAGCLRDPQARAFMVAGLCVQIGAYGLVGVFATHVRDLLAEPGHAPRWVGMLQAAAWATTFLGAAWWGRRNDRAPVERNFVVAAGACAASVALQALPRHVGWLIPLRMGQGFCNSALGQSVYLRMSKDVNADERGLRIGIANSFLTLGHVVGSLVGALLAGFLSSSSMFLVMSGFFGVAAVVVASPVQETKR